MSTAGYSQRGQAEQHDALRAHVGDGGRANPTDSPLPGVNGIADIAALRDGVAFAAGAKPGVFDARGAKKRALEANGGSFHGTTEAFKVLRDGACVQFAKMRGATC